MFICGTFTGSNEEKEHIIQNLLRKTQETLVRAKTNKQFRKDNRYLKEFVEKYSKRYATNPLLFFQEVCTIFHTRYDYKLTDYKALKETERQFDIFIEFYTNEDKENCIAIKRPFFEKFQVELLTKAGELIKQDVNDCLPFKTLLSSGKGCGKTVVASGLLLWGIMCFHSPRIFFSSNTEEQSKTVGFNTIKEIALESVLYQEVRRCKKTNKETHIVITLNDFLNFTEKEIFLAPNTYQLLEGEQNLQGIKIKTLTSSEGRKDATAGEHSKSFNFWWADEATGVTREMYSTTAGIVTSGHGMILFTFNPTVDCFATRLLNEMEEGHETWHKMIVSSRTMERPGFNLTAVMSNYHHPDDVLMYIDGQFPIKFDNAFFAHKIFLSNVHVLKGMNPTNLLTDDYVLGIDVAGGVGKNYTVCVARKAFNVNPFIEYDNSAFLLYYRNDVPLHQFVDNLIENLISGSYGMPRYIFIDGSGIGQPVAPKIRQDLITHNYQGVFVEGIIVNSPPIARIEKYKNKKTELLDKTRIWIENKDIRPYFIIPQESYDLMQYDKLKDRIKAEVTSYVCVEGDKKYNNLNTHSSLKAKDDSPDIIDALSLTFRADAYMPTRHDLR